MRKSELEKWISYYKKSLSDSLKSDVDVHSLLSFNEREYDVFQSSLKERKNLKNFFDNEEERVNKLAGVTKTDSDNWQKINVLNILIAPFYLRKSRQKIYPFWFPAKINRGGRLQVPEETFPHFQRKYLEPFADDRESFVFSSLEVVDTLLGVSLRSNPTYQDYTEYLEDIFLRATGMEISKYQAEGFEIERQGTIVLANEDIGASLYIIDLYRKMLKKRSLEDLGLLTSLLDYRSNVQKKAPIKVTDFPKHHYNHLGQMSDEFPLSYSQRVAMQSFLVNDDPVFAINGPPGTGKTVMIQNVLATKVVESAIEGKDPFIMLACSNNNQAVTNIIDSFKKNIGSVNDLSNRWLPGFEGYGTYLVSTSKTGIELAGYNYLQPSSFGLFDKMESDDYLKKAESFFKESFCSFFEYDSKHFTITRSTQYLRDKIQEIRKKIERFPDEYKSFLEAVKLLETKYCSPGKLSSYYHDDDIDREKIRKDRDEYRRIDDKVITYFKQEGFWRRILCFFGLKSALSKRYLNLKKILSGSQFYDSLSVKPKQIELRLAIEERIELANKIIDLDAQWEDYKASLGVKGNPPRSDKEYFDYEKKSLLEDLKTGAFYDELDISWRNKMFHLAIHYWEGRWLEAAKNIEYSSQGKKSTEERWKRFAMLTPCFVSTFYMAPRFFSYSNFVGKNDIGEAMWGDGTLYNFVDLLVVDEAGQVTPEIGVATFALGKRALVTGDIMQIQPIWSITKPIDLGNLKKVGLIKSYDDQAFDEVYEQIGFLSHSGSIMKMAQTASLYQDETARFGGVSLKEHRRCYNEIINYCNDLAYGGQLNPMRGAAPEDAIFPPFVLRHVNSVSKTVSKTNRSRINSKEAEELVAWLVNNKAGIEKYYGKKVEYVVGIITPFKAQKELLINNLKKAGFATIKMKIGTVHALQGAELEIVVLSLVYGPNEVGSMFFDNGPNMLNVAVSRAKDHLVVFANKKIFSQDGNTPSSRLYRYLV